MKNITLQYKKGSSTLEILLAFAILILSITSVILLGFGNQSVSADSEVSNEALYKAQIQLEDARALSRKDFFSLESDSSSDPTPEGLVYEKELDILDVSPCQKKATSNVNWNISGKDQYVSFSTLLTNVAEAFALGGDCDSTPIDEWDNPASYSITDPIHNGSAATDIDILKMSVSRYALLTTNSVAGKFTLWIVDVSSPTNPILKGGYITNETLNAVDASNTYAYLASASSTAQFQVVDVSDPINPIWKSSKKLPGVSGANPGGISIYYYNNQSLSWQYYFEC